MKKIAFFSYLIYPMHSVTRIRFLEYFNCKNEC